MASQNITVDYSLITVSNGYIEVDIAPELGLRVLAARDITNPEEPLNLFSSRGVKLTNKWLQGSGGVEPSFPFFESGTATAYQQGGYRIIEEADGAVTVAMNMRMDHRQTEMDMGFLGKYGDRPLSAWVTVRPGSNMFELTYRADNHNPTRRSNRMWNNTFFDKVTDSKAIFPVYMAADHCMKSTWVVNGNPTTEHASHFGLFPKQPFCGVWYPSSGANVLRIADPGKAPGMKLYRGGGYYEIWGSTNAVFEVPEGFVREYEPLQMTHSYYLTRSIGEAAYANEHVAISLSGANAFELVATHHGLATVKNLDGTIIVSDAPVGPGEKTQGVFTDGIEVVLNGRQVFRGELPVAIDRDVSGMQALEESAALSWGDHENHKKRELEQAESFKYARNIEMEDIQSKWWTLNAFAVAHFDFQKAFDASVTAEQCLSAANTCYRLGRINEAWVYARIAQGKSASPEADYLMGLIAWERGEAVDFGNAGVLANYKQALQAIAQNDKPAARALLREYIQAYPGSFRPRLALALLTTDYGLASACLAENPGSPEALWVMAQLGSVKAKQDLETLVDTETGSDVALQNFKKEVKMGQWRHSRRFEYNHAEFNSHFTFPDELSY